MIHLFEFIAGFALAMMAELCWRSMTRMILGTPPHIMRMLLGSTAQRRTYFVSMVWFVVGVVGAVFLGAGLVTGAWARVIVTTAGAIMWGAYTMTYYRVREIMRAETKARLEQE